MVPWAPLMRADSVLQSLADRLEATRLTAAYFDSLRIVYWLGWHGGPVDASGVYGPFVWDRYDLNGDGANDILVVDQSQYGPNGAVFLYDRRGYVSSGEISLGHEFHVCPSGGSSSVVSVWRGSPNLSTKGGELTEYEVQPGRIDTLRYVGHFIDYDDGIPFEVLQARWDSIEALAEGLRRSVVMAPPGCMNGCEMEVRAGFERECPSIDDEPAP